MVPLSFFLLRFYLFISRERGWEGEGEGEKHQLAASCTPPTPGTRPTAQACALTGNGTSDHLVHRPAPNPLSHTSQGHVVPLPVITYYPNIRPPLSPETRSMDR